MALNVHPITINSKLYLMMTIMKILPSRAKTKNKTMSIFVAYLVKL